MDEKVTTPRDVVVVDHLHLVDRIVSQMCLRIPLSRLGLDPEDLRQDGRIGLIKAAEKYDNRSGATFATYATHCIVSEIRHSVRDAGPAVTEALDALDADEPAPLAESTGAVPPTDEASDRRLTIGAAISRLPERHAAAVRMYFWDQLTKAAIADQLGITERHAGRIIEAALAALKADIGEL